MFGTGAVDERRGGVVRLAERREDRGVAPTIDRGDRYPDAERARVAIQARAFEVVPGQWAGKTAYSKNLKGLMLRHALFQWNVEKV